MSESTEDTVQIDYLQIIDNQLAVISSVIEYPDDVYDNMPTDKVKAISRAFKIIHKTQQSLLDAL